ncbi:extracellular solute-binding protein [Paenibacillus hemerocallicola]|uniref:Extracellular solute-binding protein n=1 Tax=Paenibacillus hemerocallicola TaxID=1172614 RepID=A0A5C4TBJ5_9BACL|nr:extracellular solute-binding protein [Paenibacillus hemerocallicola]TNJ66016.1 extracellular solute-binding protein [Paenibacillus hemerocallicola]
MNDKRSKRTTRRLFAALAASAIAATAATGCGGGKEGADAGGKAASPATAKQPVELNVTTGAGGSTIADIESLFNAEAIRKKFPHIKLNYIPKNQADAIKSIESLMVSGTPIDIYFDSIYVYMNTLEQFKLGYDMSAELKKFNIDPNQYDPSALNIANSSYSNKVIGLPITNTIPVLYYNKEIFDRFGVAYPKNGMTWDEMYDIARKLTRTEGGKTYLGFAFSFYHHFFHMNSLSTPYVDAKTGLSAFTSNPDWKRLIDASIVKTYESTVYQNWLKENKRIPKFDDFLLGTVAMQFSQVYGGGDMLTKLETFNYGVVSTPIFAGTKTGTQPYPTYVGVSSTSKHKEEAMEIINYLVSEEHQTYLARDKGAIPAIKNDAVRKQLYEGTPLKGKGFYEAIYHNPLAPLADKTIYDESVRSVFDSAGIIKLGTGQTDINTYLREAEEKANKKIEQEKSK